MTALAAIMTVASSFVTAAGQQQAAEAQAQAAEYQAKVQKQQAASERDAAAVEAQDFRRQGSRTRSSSLARLGGSGADPSGSPLLVDEAFVKDVALGASRIRNRGEVSATRLDQQAGLSKAQAGFARQAGSVSAGGSLLRGFAPILSGQVQFG